jgi:hypothetical protein
MKKEEKKVGKRKKVGRGRGFFVFMRERVAWGRGNLLGKRGVVRQIPTQVKYLF